MDLFKRHNHPKQRCGYCPPYKGENEGLKPQKAKARRRARRILRADLLNSERATE